MTRIDKLVISGVLLGAIIVAFVFVTFIGGHDEGTVDPATPGTFIVIDDPWCSQSEDSCTIDYRADGTWVLRRVVP